MATSLKKRSANRRNALRSTGPRTAQGRRASAANSLRHGLSVPLAPELMGPRRALVARLLVGEGVEEQVALDVADKIVEYERNMSHQRKSFICEQGQDGRVVEHLGRARLGGKDTPVGAQAVQRYLRRSTNQLLRALKRI